MWLLATTMRFSGTLLALACLLLGAQRQAAAQERTVKVVVFEPSPQPFTIEELDRFTGIKAGQPYSAARIRAAIQSLFSTGRYADIVVDAEDSPDGVVLKFVTEPSYFVSQVLVTGAKDPPNEGQLSGAAKLQLGTEFRETSIQPAIDNMQDRLRANGFYQAAIRPEIRRDPRTQEAHITFHVDAGQRARFDGIKLAAQLPPAISSERAIVRSTHWQRLFGIAGWRTATENRIRAGLDGIQNSFQNRDLLLSRVTLQRLEYHDLTNTVTPHLDLDPGPKVLLRARGEKISRGRLKQFVPIFQERSVDRDLLVEGRRNLLEYFQSQGYFDAQVGFELLPRQKDQQIVEYVLAKGERHRLANLAIKGNRYFDERTIRERLSITPMTFLRYRRGRYGQKMLDRDIDSIRALYRSNGFPEAVVIPRIVNGYKGKQSDISVTLEIAEGRQWFVKKLVIEGIPDEDRANLESELSSLEGQPFSETNIFADRDSVLSYYFNRGYPDAAFEWSLDADPEQPTQIVLKFSVRTGRRQYVRDVLVSGLSVTNPKLVDDRIRFSKGEPLADASLADTQRRLYDLGIFAKVQVAVQNPGGNEDSKNVLYQLDEARRYSVNGGFGAEIARIGGGTSFNAPAGGAGFAPRVLLGVSRINFLGLGHTISLQTRASNIQQRVLLSYFAPQFQSRENLNLTIIGLFDSSRDVRTFAARRLESSIQLGQRLSRANSVQYRYAFRRVGVDENTLNINPQLIPLFSQPTRTGIVSTTFIQDRRDDPLDARRGIYNTLDFGFSAAAFGSKASFLRLVARNASYHRVNQYVTFARSFNFGIIQRTGNEVDIPLPERFFSGGSFSHRGFPNNQAGPRDDVTGFPLGGNALLMNSLELRFPLVGDNLGGVLFHDAGNVYSEFKKISLAFSQKQDSSRHFDYMAQAIGVGFRYKTPIGPLRVDFGFSPNAARFSGFAGTRDELLRCAGPATVDPTRPRCSSVPQRINPFQFHFSLGQAF